MENDKQKFRLLDTLYILMMIVPIVFGIVLKILTTPQSEGHRGCGADL